MKPRRLRPAKVKAATARREAWRLQARMLADEREADAIVRQRAAWGAYLPSQPRPKE
jgi:hypothetical protein